MANDSVRTTDLPRSALFDEVIGNADMNGETKTVRVAIEDVARGVVRVLGDPSEFAPLAEIAIASGSLSAEQVMSALIYGRETQPLVAAGRTLIGGFEATASYLVNENGYEFDLSTMPLGIPIDIAVRSTPGYSTTVQLGVGQFFIGYSSTSNRLTVGYARSVRIMRLSTALFRVEAIEVLDDKKIYASGTTNFAVRRPDGRWRYWHYQVIAAASDTDINLPANWSNLMGADVIITAQIGVETTNVGAFALTVEKLTDTSYRVHNPNTSTQVGANTQAVIEIDGLSYSGVEIGTVAVSAANPPARTRSLVGIGQSNVQKAMTGQGPAAFEQRLSELGVTPDCNWINSAASGSSVLKGVAPGGVNFWWDQDAAAPGALTTNAIADVAAAIAAGQPAPGYLVIFQGEEEAGQYGKTGYEFVTAAAYVSAWQNVLAAFRTNLSLPALKALVFTLGGRSNPATDVGINAIRMAQLDLCDEINFFQAADAYDAALRDDGIHLNMSGQKTVWRRLAESFDVVANGATRARGPLITAFARVDSTHFDVTFSPSSGALILPADVAGFAIIATNDPGGAPLLIASKTWQSATVLRVELAADPGANPWLSWPYGGAAVAKSRLVYDSSGNPVRAAKMRQATG